MEKLITISDAEAMLILDGLVGKDLFRDISIKLESFLNYPISEEQHELMKKYDVTYTEFSWVMREYNAFNTIPEIRKRQIELGHFNDRMRKMFANILSNDGGEAIYISDIENPLLMTTYSHLVSLIGNNEADKMKPATEEEIINFLELEYE